VRETARIIEHFKETFNRLDAENLELLDSLYAEDVLFRDPLHEIQGLGALRAYFARLYAGVAACHFDFEAQALSGDTAMLTWTMHLRLHRFRRGETLALPGATHLRLDARVRYHRDYFDVGALLYERLPVLGALLRRVRSAM